MLFELIDIRRWVEGYWSGDDPRSHLPQDSCVLDPESMSLLFGVSALAAVELKMLIVK